MKSHRQFTIAGYSTTREQAMADFKARWSTAFGEKQTSIFFGRRATQSQRDKPFHDWQSTTECNHGHSSRGTILYWRSSHVMPWPILSHPLTSQPINTRPCPKCGLPMFVTRISPSTDVDHEERTYECPACNYSKIATVRFR